MRFHPTAIPVYYSPKMVADSRSYSPSVAKPAAVVDRWRNAVSPFRSLRPPRAPNEPPPSEVPKASIKDPDAASSAGVVLIGAEQWLSENSAAIADYNARVDRQGTFGAQFGMI